MFTQQLNLASIKSTYSFYLFVYHSLNSTTMARVTIVFFTLVLVLLFSNFSSEARRVPDAVTSTITAASNKDIAEESCVGVGKEECLMRRTLVAHLDYIYTQEKNP